MRLKVLVPSEEYKSYAGARIRYGRLQPELSRLGIELLLEDIATFAPGGDACDVLLISKCHDARALIAAAAAFDRGQLVGVDLFDDYFSQRSDSRLNRYRGWLRQLLQTCNFALCSTPAMATVVQSYRADIAVHVVNDPAPDLNFSGLAEILDSKLQHVRNGRTIRVAWFGVGDNPHFRVGLADLAAFAGTVHELSSGDMTVELNILTNPRALTADGLALIQESPVRTTIGEWSLEAEKRLLDEAMACFLPVNAQPFSAAKSLNRAVTALTAGCQVISVGYPLYQPLADFIYRDPATSMRDIDAGSVKHSPKMLDAFAACMKAVASAPDEAARLAVFLKKVKPPKPDRIGPLVVVHGSSTSGAAHKAARALQGLSIASPYCAPQPTFDVLFRDVGGRLAMLVSDRAARHLVAGFRDRLAGSETVVDKRFRILTDENERDGGSAGPLMDPSGAPLPVQLATYASTLARIDSMVEAAFGRCRIVYSENSNLPFSIQQ